MKVQVHAIHFNADQKLIDSIQAKLDKLETFYDRITSGEVFLKVSTGLGKVKEKFLEIPPIEDDTVFLTRFKGYEIRVFSVILASEKSIIL